MQGVLGKIGRCNAKDTPLPDSSHTENDVFKSVTTLMNTIYNISEANENNMDKPKSKGFYATCKMVTNLSNDEIHKFKTDISTACTNAEDDTPYFTNMNSVMKARKLTRNMVISQLDKADSSLVAM